MAFFAHSGVNSSSISFEKSINKPAAVRLKMPDLIVDAGSRVRIKALESFHLSAECTTVHDDTHNVHRQA